MTVVPNRPPDGNRRPTIRSTGVRSGLANGTREPSSELPPVLFHLPNLKPKAENPVAADDHEGAADSETSSAVQDAASVQTDALSSKPVVAESASSQSATSTKTVSATPLGRSIVSRLISNAMLLGVLALGGMWVYVVAKNVQTTAKAPSTASETSGEFAGDGVELLADSAVSLEDTVANAERLALNPNGNLPTVANAQPAKETPKSETGTTDAGLLDSSEMMAEVEAAAQQAQQSLVLHSAAPSPSIASESLASELESSQTQLAASDLVANKLSVNADDDFSVTMPSAVVSEQTAAMPASSRSPTGEEAAGLVALVPPVQETTVSETPELPEANHIPQSSQPISTSTPNALTPPLPSELDTVLAETGADSIKTASSKADVNRQFTKTPTAVSDWLQYLPPPPKP